MGKRLDAQLKQESRMRHKNALIPYKGPYDCPRCFTPKTLNVRKKGETAKTIDWLVFCDKCSLFQVITLPKAMEQIDLINKLTDMVRRNEIK